MIDEKYLFVYNTNLEVNPSTYLGINNLLKGCGANVRIGPAMIRGNKLLDFGTGLESAIYMPESHRKSISTSEFDCDIELNEAIHLKTRVTMDKLLGHAK
jgi:hypothetical protein